MAYGGKCVRDNDNDNDNDSNTALHCTCLCEACQGNPPSILLYCTYRLHTSYSRPLSTDPVQVQVCIECAVKTPTVDVYREMMMMSLRQAPVSSSIPPLNNLNTFAGLAATPTNN